MNHKRFLVLSDEDFGCPLVLSRTDNLLDCYAEAEDVAEKSIQGGSALTYLFELKEVYIAEGDRRRVPVIEVELRGVRQAPSEGYGGSD